MMTDDIAPALEQARVEKDAEIARLDQDYRTLLAAYAELGVKLAEARAALGVKDHG